GGNLVYTLISTYGSAPKSELNVDAYFSHHEEYTSVFWWACVGLVVGTVSLIGGLYAFVLLTGFGLVDLSGWQEIVAMGMALAITLACRAPGAIVFGVVNAHRRNHRRVYLLRPPNAEEAHYRNLIFHDVLGLCFNNLSLSATSFSLSLILSYVFPAPAWSLVHGGNGKYILNGLIQCWTAIFSAVLELGRFSIYAHGQRLFVKNTAARALGLLSRSGEHVRLLLEHPDATRVLEHILTDRQVCRDLLIAVSYYHPKAGREAPVDLLGDLRKVGKAFSEQPGMKHVQYTKLSAYSVAFRLKWFLVDHEECFESLALVLRLPMVTQILTRKIEIAEPLVRIVSNESGQQ